MYSGHAPVRERANFLHPRYGLRTVHEYLRVFVLYLLPKLRMHRAIVRLLALYRVSELRVYSDFLRRLLLPFGLHAVRIGHQPDHAAGPRHTRTRSRKHIPDIDGVEGATSAAARGSREAGAGGGGEYAPANRRGSGRSPEETPGRP